MSHEFDIILIFIVNVRRKLKLVYLASLYENNESNFVLKHTCNNCLLKKVIFNLLVHKH